MSAFEGNHQEGTKHHVRMAQDAMRRAGDGFASGKWGYSTDQLGKAIEYLKIARFHVDVLNLLQLKEELELEVINLKGEE